MTVSTAELFQLGDLVINDGPDADFFIESFNFTPAQKKPVLVSNPDADGELLARESHYSDATMEWMIRVADQGTTAATLAKLGELVDAVQACEKIVGGQPLVWTVHETEKPYTGYAKTGDFPELPVTPTGDLAGWLIDFPVIKVKLTCSPFWTRPQRVIKASTESPAEPMQTLYVGGVLGDVPAEAELVVTDKAAQDRRFAAVGRDVVTSEANPALLVKSNALVTAGFSGFLTPSGGAFSAGLAVKASAATQATVMFSTGRISHVGVFTVYLRVKALTANLLFRISYRNGDGPLRFLDWKPPTVVLGWSEICLGEVFLDELGKGTQTSEIRFEQISTGGAGMSEGDYLLLWPTAKSSSRARGIAVDSPTALLGYDNFEQAEGNLEGKAPAYPAITWTEAVRTGSNGFQVASADYLERTAVSDASIVSGGSFALFGATTYATIQEAITVKAGTLLRSGASRVGLLARYVNATNYLAAVLVLEPEPAGRGSEVLLQILSVVAGSVSFLGSVPIKQLNFPRAEYSLREDLKITLLAAANGNWIATVPSSGKEERGRSADLAPGATLAAGKVGLLDVYTAAAAGKRMLDGFELLGAEEPGRVCYSNRKVQFDFEGCQRQDSTGVYYGPPSMYRGGDLYLEPEGELGLINRLAVRMRRNDNDVEEDAPVTDKHTCEVLATERFLLPR